MLEYRIRADPFFRVHSGKICNSFSSLLFVRHSAKKGHVSNQSLYKGWKQSFPSFCHDQKMDIILCQDGQLVKCRNEIISLLVPLLSQRKGVYMNYEIMNINVTSNAIK